MPYDGLFQPFNFDYADDDDLALLALADQEQRARMMAGGSGAGNMFNFYLNYSTPLTVVNTTTETPLLGVPDLNTSKIITPSFARVGQTYQLSFRSSMGWAGTPTLTMRLKLNAVTLQTYFGGLAASAFVSPWRLDLFATITTVGAGGIIAIEPGTFELAAVNVTPIAQYNGLTNLVTPAVDFSINQVWELTQQWGTAAIANSFVYNFGCINVL